MGDHLVRRRNRSASTARVEQKQQLLRQLPRQAACRDRLHRAGRRHRRAGCHAHRAEARRRRLGPQRSEDLEHPPRTWPTTSCCWCAPTAPCRALPGADAVPGAVRRRGRHRSREFPKLGMRATGFLRRRPRRRVRARRAPARRAGQAWYMLLPTLNNERHHALGVLLGDPRRRPGGCPGLHEASARRSGTQIGEFQVLQHYVADIAIAAGAGRPAA